MTHYHLGSPPFFPLLWGAIKSSSQSMHPLFISYCIISHCINNCEINWEWIKVFIIIIILMKSLSYLWIAKKPYEITPKLIINDNIKVKSIGTLKLVWRKVAGILWFGLESCPIRWRNFWTIYQCRHLSSKEDFYSNFFCRSSWVPDKKSDSITRLVN